jgi:exo-1,4-beta-D-glucosaminidase
MQSRRISHSWLLPVLLIAGALAAAQTSTVPLDRGWQIQSGCNLKITGEEISSPKFHPEGWLATSVPSTVLGAQVNAGKFLSPFFGMNLRKIPGTDYPITKIYANLPMTDGSPYRCSWWYRKEFAAPFPASDITWLRFNGINYRANIWINGKLLASSDEVAGAYRIYEFNISKFLRPGKNVVAVETFAPSENDLGINFVDWNPAPADKSMGLWRDVSLLRSGAVRVRNATVNTRFEADDLKLADLTVIADVANDSNHTIKTILEGTIGTIRFVKTVVLAPESNKVIRFTPDEFPQLKIRNPKVWWPYQYGTPNLYTLKLSALASGTSSDSEIVRFGIREVSADLNEKGYRQFKINRRNILIRGGGWAPDMFYREPKQRLRQELEYVKHLNLNTIRLEGKLGSDDMFDLADQMGILIMAGWCCCDHWEHWDKWVARDHKIANASLYSQISRLRSHPSVFVWLNGSDGPPPAPVESDYISVLKERDWNNPVVSSATSKPTSVTGASGVKMTGPYDYVPPEYWYLDKNQRGGAYGFNTETGPGPAIPSVAEIKRTLPKESWWPQDDQWNFHAGIGRFAQYNNFNIGMTATYGAPKDLDDYVRKAQLMAYDGERAMFEAYTANKYTSTGVIQWMLNNAWPSFIWHLYDYYLVPGGGYFGTRKANEPVHALYRYDDRKILVVNSALKNWSGLRISAHVFNLEGKNLFTQSAAVDVPPDGVSPAFEIPERPSTTFLKLELRDAQNKILSENFYWIPAKLAQLDWPKSSYFHTPAISYADMKDLAEMPEGRIRAMAWEGRQPGTAHLRLTNTGSTVAFFLHAQAVRTGSDEEIVPVFWNDNFISLLPGETRELTVTIPSKDKSLQIKVDGWNIRRLTVRTDPAQKRPVD